MSTNSDSAPAPRSGRRAADSAAGYDPNDPYVREVLGLAADNPVPPAAKNEDEAVDFDRLIAEDDDAPPNFDRLMAEDDDAPPNFDLLAAREAETAVTAGGFAVYGEPGTQAPAPGVLSDIPVYGDPGTREPGESSDFPVYGDPVAQPSASPAPAVEVNTPAPGESSNFPVYGEPIPGALSDIPVYGAPETLGAAPAGAAAAASRDVGVSDKPDFYEDPSTVEAGHNVRFRPGSSYSSGNRNAYRTDARGVPAFAPGWNAAAVSKSFARARNVRCALAVAMIAASAGLAVAGVGSNADYLELKAVASQVPSTVVSVISESAQDSEESAAVDRLGVTTTETATVEFSLDGTKHRHELSSSSQGGTALMGASTQWEQGATVNLLVDPADPARAAVVDEKQMERINLFTLIPLVPAALFAAGAAAAANNTRKMRRIAAAEA